MLFDFYSHVEPVCSNNNSFLFGNFLGPLKALSPRFIWGSKIKSSGTLDRTALRTKLLRANRYANHAQKKLHVEISPHVVENISVVTMK